jgi:hypothetical protein
VAAEVPAAFRQRLGVAPHPASSAP